MVGPTLPDDAWLALEEAFAWAAGAVEALGIGHSTAERDWAFAKAWLSPELR